MWVCVLGLGFWAAPRHSWLGCWGVRVCVRDPLVPATPGWGVRRGCLCLGSGFGCAPPLLALVFGCVCARVRALLVPRDSWLGSALWVCVFGLWFRLLPATPDWGVGLCVCSCAHSACTPPLPAGVCGVGMCVWARVSVAPRHSWLGWWGVCVLVCAVRLYPATPGWDVLCRCVCLGSSGDRDEVVQGHGTRLAAAVGHLGSPWLLSRPVCLLEVGNEAGRLSAVMPDTPPSLLPLELVAHGLDLRFDGAIDGDILADLAELLVQGADGTEAADQQVGGYSGQCGCAGHAGSSLVLEVVIAVDVEDPEAVVFGVGAAETPIVLTVRGGPWASRGSQHSLTVFGLWLLLLSLEVLDAPWSSQRPGLARWQAVPQRR